jgi:biotin-dependent carboxylase-like uncharacterized protein
VLRVVDPGPSATVQDLGRRGVAHLGVARAGAFDRGAHRHANLLVGNDAGAAALEVLLGPFVAEATCTLTLAVAGTDAVLSVDGRPAPPGAAVVVEEGARIVLGAPRRGLRTTLAVAGGIEVPPVLGSRSTDHAAGLGPPALAPGDMLQVGAAPPRAPFPAPSPPVLRDGLVVLRVLPGPRLDRLPGGLGALGRTTWSVAPASDRTGVRLVGEPLPVDPAALPSEGMPPGAVQVPPDGLPIVLGPDAGTTGGYPVVAVVVDEDRDLLAQLRPGEALGFVPVVDW